MNCESMHDLTRRRDLLHVSSFVTAVKYAGVVNTGVNGGMAYMSAELSLFSIDFSLVNKQAVPLCYEQNDYYEDEQVQNGYDAEGYAGYYDNGDANGDADNGNADNGDGGRRHLEGQNEDYYDNAGCPGDGTYPFSIEYVLPSAGTESASWLASGWQGTGLLEMYAQRNDAMKIGECTLTLATYVTKKNEDVLLGTPSAAATAGIILAIIFAAVLMCCYCYCCIKKRQTKKAELDAGDDITSNFRRMDTTDLGDEHSKPPSISLDAHSQATGKKSAKSLV